MLLYFSVYGIVPFLSVVMGTMLPMLGMAKHDNMKWVFSAGGFLLFFAQIFEMYNNHYR